MIDTHCHLLEGLDDGPPTLEASVELATQLVADGVTCVVCTPHYSRRFATRHEDALAAAERLERELSRAALELQLVVAAEISPARAMTAEPEELRPRSVGGRFLLVELVPDTPPQLLYSLVGRLGKLGLVPIVAHPERCRAVQRRPALLDAARSEGALVQIVAPSLIGAWGDAVVAAAWRLLDTGRADLLASDSHGRRSPPRLAAAAQLVADRLGERVSHALTDARPRLVLEGVHPAARAPAAPGARQRAS